MAKIAFFCIPAHGHTNPTLGVVAELCRRGHKVWYWSFEAFRQKIEAAGAQFFPCDELAPAPDMDPARVGLDMAASIRVLADATLALDGPVCDALRRFSPDCVIADSMAVWGRFAAQKLGLRFISSTTTFAFNRYSAKCMPPAPGGLGALFRAMPSVQRDVWRLRRAGYPVKNMLSLIANDEDADTIVYTSPQFQPCADTFGSHYAFVGPVLRAAPEPWPKAPGKKLVYISLGTVNNTLPEFYANCIVAMRDLDCQTVLSVGEKTDIAALGPLPKNVTAAPFVDQLAVLQSADAFVTHCGMNSASEALYYNVPLVLFPQTSEQGAVANRVEQLGAGVRLAEPAPQAIREAVRTALEAPHMRAAACRVGEGLRAAGGAGAAADAVERFLAEPRTGKK